MLYTIYFKQFKGLAFWLVVFLDFLFVQKLSFAQPLSNTYFKVLSADENGIGHMNINVIEAHISGKTLMPGDEIGIFSHNQCVGVVKIDDNIQQFMTVTCSEDDGTGSGFYENDTIVFQIWSHANKKIYTINRLKYYTIIPTWDNDGKFTAGGTAFVEIEALEKQQHVIALSKGMNLISTYLKPENPMAVSFFSELIEKDIPFEVYDEKGALIFRPGDENYRKAVLSNNKAFSLWIAESCHFEISGFKSSYPPEFSLKKGVNYLAYPFELACTPKSYFHELIIGGSLHMIFDQQGNSFRFSETENSWVNEIGCLRSGQGYVVIVNNDVEFTPSVQQDWMEPKKTEILKYTGNFYNTSTLGNGYAHMQLELIGLEGLNLEPDDEIGIFDDNLCVSIITGSQKNETQRNTVILSSAFREREKGFANNNPITIKLWRKGMNEDINLLTTFAGNGVFTSYAFESVILNFPIVTPLHEVEDTHIKLWPNPAIDNITVKSSVNTHYIIYNSKGIPMKSGFLTKDSTVNISLQHYASGIYIICLKSDGKDYFKKLIVR